MPAAYGYARVSTLDQAKHGASLAAQHEAIQRYFDYALAPRDFTFAGCFDDAAVSGKKPLRDRPAGQRLNGLVSAGDIVVFSKLDRAFRNTQDCLTLLKAWKDQDVRVAFLDLPGAEGPMGEFIITIFAAVAQMENTRRLERILEGKAAKEARGEYSRGSVPYGFRCITETHAGRPRKVLVENVEQRRWGREILRLARAGWNDHDIFSHLCVNRVYFFTKNQNFCPTHVRRIIQYELRAEQREAAGWTPPGLKTTAPKETGENGEATEDVEEVRPPTGS